MQVYAVLCVISCSGKLSGHRAPAARLSGRDKQAPCEAWVPGFVTSGDPKELNSRPEWKSWERLHEETLPTFVAEHPKVYLSRTS